MRPQPLEYMLTHNYLLSVLAYDCVTGVFIWRQAPNHSTRAGSIAGSEWKGYIRIGICRRRYKRSRLAWFYIHGRWPARGVDHRNGISTDDRIENLREATQSENCQNRRVSIRNTSGFTGVTLNRSRQSLKKWQAKIGVNGRDVPLGYFETSTEAYVAYLAAKAQKHHFQPVPRL